VAERKLPSQWEGKITTGILSLKGYDVACSTNREETLKIYETAFFSGNPIDDIFLDLNLNLLKTGQLLM
jgi:hypothetical protein